MTDPDRIASLEASGRAALPSLEERPAGGWMLRVSGGDTKRVNSVNAVAPSVRVAAMRESAERLYAANGLPCRFRLTPLAHPDSDAPLADAGYQEADPSFTMTAVPTVHAADPALRLTAVADVEALATAALLSGRHPAAQAVHARLLAAVPGAKACAVLVEDDAPVAAGFVSVGRGRAQLADIVVAPAARGRGIGRRLVAGLLGWAHGQGCGEAMLQVLATNDPARRLYRSLGFNDAYAYHYRVRE